MHAGGGDWNGDGLMDFLHMPFAGNPYKLFPGERVGEKGLKFKEGGLKACTVLQVGNDRQTKAPKCAWAWDYSGTAKKRGVVEYVGISPDQKGIAFFELAGGQSRLTATLTAPDGQTPLLTAGDFNRDGSMDIVFSCGLWNNETAKTKIYVMYGKVENSPDSKMQTVEETEEEKKSAAKPEQPKPKEKPNIEIPDGCSGIELKDGEVIIVKEFQITGQYINYVTENGESGKVSYRKVRRIRRR